MTSSIDGPYASLLAASTDLGPAREQSIQLTASLTDQSEPTSPDRLGPGQGAVGPVASRRRLGDRRGRTRLRSSGHSTSPCATISGKEGPALLRLAAPARGARRTCAARSSEMGRILSYTPHHMSRPDNLPLDVPDHGLAPDALLNTYNADDLARAGITGKGSHHRDLRLRRVRPVRPGQVHHHVRPAAVHPGGRRRTARRSHAASCRWISSGTCHCARCAEGRRERPSHRRGRAAGTARSVRCSRTPTAGSPVRYGASRSAGAATNSSPPPTWPRCGPRCDRPVARHHRLQRQR